MSDKLERIPLDSKLGPVSIETLLVTRLNAAITRINELEARYEGHFHSAENTVTGSHEPGHSHTLSRPQSNFTTPPIPGGEDAK